MAADSGLMSSLELGTPQLQSAGPLAFGSEGILFVGDARGAAVFAIATRGGTIGEKGAPIAAVRHAVTDLTTKVGTLSLTACHGNGAPSIRRTVDESGRSVFVAEPVANMQPAESASSQPPLEERLQIFVAGSEGGDRSDLPPVAGDVTRVDDTLQFWPAFPLQPGARYRDVLRSSSGTPIVTVFRSSSLPALRHARRPGWLRSTPLPRYSLRICSSSTSTFRRPCAKARLTRESVCSAPTAAWSSSPSWSFETNSGIRMANAPHRPRAHQARS